MDSTESNVIRCLQSAHQRSVRGLGCGCEACQRLLCTEPTAICNGHEKIQQCLAAPATRPATTSQGKPTRCVLLFFLCGCVLPRKRLTRRRASPLARKVTHRLPRGGADMLGKDAVEKSLVLRASSSAAASSSSKSCWRRLCACGVDGETLFVCKGLGSYVHVCPVPCLSTYRWARLMITTLGQNPRTKKIVVVFFMNFRVRNLSHDNRIIHRPQCAFSKGASCDWQFPRDQ